MYLKIWTCNRPCNLTSFMEVQNGTKHSESSDTHYIFCALSAVSVTQEACGRMFRLFVILKKKEQSDCCLKQQFLCHRKAFCTKLNVWTSIPVPQYPTVLFSLFPVREPSRVLIADGSSSSRVSLPALISPCHQGRLAGSLVARMTRYACKQQQNGGLAGSCVTLAAQETRVIACLKTRNVTQMVY